MSSEHFYSAVTLVFILTLAIITRRSIASIFLFSISIFVTALPWFRLGFSASVISYSDEIIISTYFAIFLFSLGVVLMSYRYRSLAALNPIWIRHSLAKNINSSQLIFFFLVLSVAWVFRIYRASTYGILFSGSVHESTIASQSYIFVIAMSLLDMASLAAFYYICIFSKKRPLLIWFLISSEIGWALVFGGRRNLIFMLSVLLFVKLVSIKSVKTKFKIVIIVLVLTYLTINVISPIFLYSRVHVLNYMINENAFDSLIWGVGDAVQDLISGNLQSAEILRENFSERGDAGGFLSSVINAMASSNSFLLGNAFTTALIWSVPSMLIDKPQYMVEQHIQTSLGMPIRDQSISWMAVAYADFGLLGCLFYGMIFISGLALLIYLAKKTRSEFLYVIASLQTAYIAYNVEADPVVLFSSIRNMIILVICYKLYKTAKVYHSRSLL